MRKHANLGDFIRLIIGSLSLGKTAEAKSDLARLQEVRARREAAAAQRKAEADGGSTFLQNSVAELMIVYEYRKGPGGSCEEGKIAREETLIIYVN